MFLNRAVIKASNVEEAITILRNKGYGSAYGFCTNIADVKFPSRMWSIELGPQAEESILHVHTIEEESDPSKPCHFIHYNKFEFLTFSEISGPSSIAREQRANQLDPPRSRQDILVILGDTSDEKYPLFRSERPTDRSETVFTTVVDVLHKRVDIYRGNPRREGAFPLLKLTIDCESAHKS